MKLEQDALRLLQSMQRSDGRKYTAGPIDRRRYELLEQEGLIQGTRVGPTDIVYTLLPAAEKILHSSDALH